MFLIAIIKPMDLLALLIAIVNTCLAGYVIHVLLFTVRDLSKLVKSSTLEEYTRTTQPMTAVQPPIPIEPMKGIDEMTIEEVMNARIVRSE